MNDLPKTEPEQLSKPSGSIFGRLRNSRKFAVCVIFIATLLDGIFYGILVPLVPIYQEDFQLSDSEAGELVSYFFFSNLFISVE